MDKQATRSYQTPFRQMTFESQGGLSTACPSPSRKARPVALSAHQAPRRLWGGLGGTGEPQSRARASCSTKAVAEPFYPRRGWRGERWGQTRNLRPPPSLRGAGCGAARRDLLPHALPSPPARAEAAEEGGGGRGRAPQGSPLPQLRLLRAPSLLPETRQPPAGRPRPLSGHGPPAAGAPPVSCCWPGPARRALIGRRAVPPGPRYKAARAGKGPSRPRWRRWERARARRDGVRWGRDRPRVSGRGGVGPGSRAGRGWSGRRVGGGPRML